MAHSFRLKNGLIFGSYMFQLNTNIFPMSQMKSMMAKTPENLLNCKITHTVFKLQMYKELMDLRMTVKPIIFISKESLY